MGLTTYFRAQAHNNAWANHRILSACSMLSVAELNEARTGFFPNIIHTLNHILTVDLYYISGLEGASSGPAAFDPEVPYPDFEALSQQQRSADRRLITFCVDLTEARLSTSVDLRRKGFVQQERIDRTLLHLFQHQIHHRGQVHTMLSSTNVAPPQLDEFFLERGHVLRAQEFEALGFSEQDVWQA